MGMQKDIILCIDSLEDRLVTMDVTPGMQKFATRQAGKRSKTPFIALGSGCGSKPLKSQNASPKCQFCDHGNYRQRRRVRGSCFQRT